MRLRIATRRSPLALIQAEQVRAELLRHCPDLQGVLVPIVTTGDQVQDRPLAAIGGKGLFIKQLEEALWAGDAEIAVHSLKDVPPVLDEAFCLGAVLPRQSPFDTLVSLRYDSLDALPARAVVGTGSVRRQAALRHIRPDLDIKMVRGNVETRLKKLEANGYDALILAEAGLNRLGLSDRVRMILSPEVCTPSVGQGVIAIECLKKRRDVLELLEPVHDIDTFVCILAERTMNAHLNARCTSPVGSFARLAGDQLQLRGVVWSADGKNKIETFQRGDRGHAREIGETAAADLIRQGAAAFL